MTNKEELITLIKFQLSHLSEQNAQFEFEHLCRRLARVRICSNIIPATGPVVRTGDQGRDFETFKTALQRTDIANTSFIGLISKEMLAFACSIQKTNIESKILSDVKKITSSGTEIERIYFFSSTAIKIADNHKIKERVLNDYNVPLEILDIEWISENLADPDTFWIANKYLSIPSEMYPKPQGISEWYQKTYDKWKKKDDRLFNYGEFGEIKIAARYALETEELNPEIPFWLELLKSFQNKELLPKFERKIIYETAVISFKALKDLKGQEEYLRKYLNEIQALNDVGDYQDYFSLLLYSSTAFTNNVVNLEEGEMKRWFKSFIARLDEEIKELENKDRITLFCHLLFLRGALTIKFSSMDESIDKGLDYWEKLLALVDKAPLFPLKLLSETFINFIDLLSDNPRYQYFTTKIDEFLSVSAGKAIAAESCVNRAKIFYDKGKLLRALDEIHKAKISWFTDETLPQAISAVLAISEWYRELGLMYASKYYALAAALTIDTTDDTRLKFFLPRALFIALKNDYLQGAWCSFMNFSKVVINAHVNFEREPFNLEKHELIRNLLIFVNYVMYLSARLDGNLGKIFYEKGYKLFEEDLIKEGLELTSKQYDPLHIEELRKIFDEQLNGRPFNDVFPEREVIWSELGIEWHVRWKNNYQITPIAEQYIAIAQILLADFAGLDLCLLKSKVIIELDVHEKDRSDIIPIKSDEGTIWIIKLPKNNEIFDDILSHMSTITTILEENSLLGRNDFANIFLKKFKESIQSKIYIGSSYEAIYRRYISKELFDDCNSIISEVPGSDLIFNIKENESLGWFNEICSTYDELKNKEYLKAHYENLLKNIKYSLPKLLEEQVVRDIIHDLKVEGWLDWQILNVLADIISYYRVTGGDKLKIDTFEDLKKLIEVFKKETKKEEKEEGDNLPVPTKIFSKELVKAGLMGLMSSSIKIYDLDYHQFNPDYNTLRYFLEKRLNYLKDDIEHEDPFRNI